MNIVDMGGSFGHGNTRFDEMTSNSFTDLAKALQAGYGTDSALLTGGGAIRVESLDATLYAVTQSEKHFKFWQDLSKSRAGATVDEWVRKPSTGGWPGSATNAELGEIQERTGTYERKTEQVKYMMTRRSVSFVQLQQRTIVASQAQEQVNGALELLQTTEHQFFYGDQDVVPEQFDGLFKILTAEGSPFRDSRAAPLDPELITEVQAEVASLGNWGYLTHMYPSNLVQADLDVDLDPAYRVPLTNIPNGGIQHGAPVAGVRTSWGDIVSRPDPFVRESWAPQEVIFPGTATSSDPTPPATVAMAAVVDATTKFETAHLGSYFYAVTAVNSKGISSATLSAGAQAVVAGERIDVTTTAAGAADQKGFYIFRSIKDGAGAAASDFRFVAQIAGAGAGAFVYQDKNIDIPGCSTVFLVNLGTMAGGSPAASVRQLLPMTRFSLYPTNKAEVPWAQLLFLYLRITKPEQCAMVKNVLPKKATWRPFG